MYIVYLWLQVSSDWQALVEDGYKEELVVNVASREDTRHATQRVLVSPR